MIVEQMLKNAQTPLLHIADVSGSALFQGDCLDIMPLIPDKSVQLILADLPYGTTACKWDSIIDLDSLWKQYKRIIKVNGAIVLTASQPFTTKLISSNYEMFKYEIIWNKTHGANFFNLKYQPFKTHENILIFGRNILYNPIRESRTESSLKRYRKGVELQTPKGNPEHYGAEIDDMYILKDDKHPSSIVNISSKSEKRNGIKHPTKKPLELMKYLILTYSNENDMVLDNTMGSGTTCLAAKELNRKFIGIEKEPKYYEIACNRCGFSITSKIKDQHRN